MRKRKKKERFGIKFPNSKVEEVAFLSPSSSGCVFGVTDSDQHITLVDEGKSISTHRTFHGKGKSDHLGRMVKSDVPESFWLDTLKIRKLPQSKMDMSVLYITKKWSLLNIPDDVLYKKKETEKEIISYIDLEEIFKQTSLFFQQLRSAPEDFIGLCSAKQILTSRKIVLGLLLGTEKAVMKVDGTLYEMDLSSIRESLLEQSDSVPNNPLFNILQSLGFIAFRASFLQRLTEKTER